jgi:hypothetical protein
MSTRLSIIEKAALRIGAKVGTLSSATTNSLVLGDHVGTTGDDNAFVNWLVWRMSASTAADDERRVKSWVDSTGTAEVDALTDTTVTNENYVLVPPDGYALADYRKALNEMLVGTRRSIWSVTPTVSEKLNYSLAGLTAIRSHEDVLAVFRRNHTPVVAAGSFEDYDWTANYLRSPVSHYKVIQSEGVTYLELPQAISTGGELVIVYREPYTALTTDADSVTGTTTCPDSVAVPGLLYYLARQKRKGVDRERWDAIEARFGREYALASRALQQVPTPEPQRSVFVRGA